MKGGSDQLGNRIVVPPLFSQLKRGIQEHFMRQLLIVHLLPRLNSSWPRLARLSMRTVGRAVRIARMFLIKAL